MSHHEVFSELLATLNDQQLKAVNHIKGPLLIIAGAGSGKTRVITTRIINLLTHHLVAPHAIVALTFTNKAAREMKERVALHLSNASGMPTISTFHGYCLQLLRMYGELIDLPLFTIMDSDDQLSLIQSILKRNNLEKRFSAKTVAHHISGQKNSLAAQERHSNKMLQEIAATYEREKQLSKAIDFDDLLVHAHRLFSHEEFKSSWQSRTRHILVDEYQDTNLIQHALLKKMACISSKQLAVDSLCVVGDEDQSIYAWRGATVTNILNFPQEFDNTTSITIERNYRSAQDILDVANSVIKHNRDRNPKKLWSGKTGANRVIVVQCSSGYQEADLVTATLGLARSTFNNCSAAVLYRAHYQSRVIEESLIKAAIPYVVIGGIQFYERKEIKDLLAYLRLAVNPHDRISCLRIINCPTRGLGQKFEDLLIETWQQFPEEPLKAIIHHFIEIGTVTGKKADALKDFLEILDAAASLAPFQALEFIIQRVRYISYLLDTFDKEEADAKVENVKELMRAFSHFESTGNHSLEHLLQEIALMQEKGDKKQTEGNTVFLMTCHAAKGLEFDLVVLTGLEEGTFPSSRGGYSDEQVEEERRLLYVGITRAREWLLLSHAHYRYTYGTTTYQQSSRFLDEINPSLVHHADISKQQGSSAIQELLNDWFGKSNAQSKSPKKTTAAQSVSFDFEDPFESPVPAVAWKKNQPVLHASFGVGVIHDVDVKKETEIYITARFSSGLKKIKADFLKPA